MLERKFKFGQKSDSAHDVSFTATEWQFTHNLPRRRTYDVSVFKLKLDRLGLRNFVTFLATCYYKTPFSQLEAQAVKTNHWLFEVCKYVMLFVSFYSIAVYNSAVMEFWPLSLEQRIKLVLSFKFYVARLK